VPVLPDVLPEGLDLVICGTAAGAASARREAYYAGPGNRFWSTLFQTGLTDRLLRPREFAQLPEFGIGLTDVEKAQSGADADIDFRHASAMALRRRVVEAGPRVLCFNGKKAAQVALEESRVGVGLQEETFGTTLLFVAPSTSGLATRWWDVKVWHELAELIRGE